MHCDVTVIAMNETAADIDLSTASLKQVYIIIDIACGIHTWPLTPLL